MKTSMGSHEDFVREAEEDFKALCLVPSPTLIDICGDCLEKSFNEPDVFMVYEPLIKGILSALTERSEFNDTLYSAYSKLEQRERNL